MPKLHFQRFRELCIVFRYPSLLAFKKINKRYWALSFPRKLLFFQLFVATSTEITGHHNAEAMHVGS